MLMAWVRCCGGSSQPRIKYIVQDGVIKIGTPQTPAGTSMTYDSANSRLIVSTAINNRNCYLNMVENVSKYTKLCVTYQNYESGKPLIVTPTIDGAQVEYRTNSSTIVLTMNIPISGDTLSQIMFAHFDNYSTTAIYNMWLE